MSLPVIHIIAGPTASGKSAAALMLAQSANGVIINADSQQVYRDLPILTARPSAADEKLVPHRLYGFVEADEHFSAGKWLRFAKMEIDWARSEGHSPIVVGGTGLYLKALMEGIAEIPDIDPAVRKQATNDYEQMGKEAYVERLKHVDPDFFVRLTVVDKQRLIRAYEVWLGTGKNLTYWQQQKVTPIYASDEMNMQIVSLPREELYQRCDARFEIMLKQGALDEVREILESRVEGSYPSLEKIIGFRELAAHITGEMSIEDATTKAQQMTRNYAKRQVTWLKNQFNFK